MNCALDNFNEEFDNILQPGKVVDISYNNRLDEIIQYATLANKTAKSQGYNISLFDVNIQNDKTTIETKKEILDEYKEYLDFFKKSWTEIEIDNNFFNQEVNQYADLKDLGIENEVTTPEEIQNNVEDLTEIVNDNIEEEINFSLAMGTIPNSAVQDYSVWLRSRKQILWKLKNNIKRLKKISPDKKDLIHSLRVQEELLMNEIKNIDTTNINTVEMGLKKEIESLNALFDEISNPINPAESLTKLESGMIEDRLNAIDYILNTVEDDGVAFAFYNIREGISPESIDNIIKEFSDLQLKYKAAIPKIIATIVTNDPYIVSLKAMALSQEEIDNIDNFVAKMEQVILEGNINEMGGDNPLGGSFLSAGSYNNILTKMLHLAQERNIKRESGVNALHKQSLLNSYKTLIKELGYSAVKRFWQTDELGTHTNKIVNFFNPTFESKLSDFRKAEREFFESSEGTYTEEESFRDLMNNLKNSVDTFKLHLVPEIAEKYKNNKYFKKYFDNVTEQEQKAYEKELRDRLGDATYENLVSQQIEKLEDYLTDPYIIQILNGIDDSKNPFVYSNHFYSDKYQEALDNGKYPNSRYIIKIPKNRDDINSDFLALEEEAKNKNVGEEFKNFYKAANTLIRYNKQTKSSFGIIENQNSIVELEDYAKREMIANSKPFLRVAYYSKNTVISFFRDWFAPFSRGTVENESLDSNFSKDKRQLETHFDISFSNKRDLYFNLYKTYPTPELLKEAEKLGIDKNILNKLILSEKGFKLRKTLINGIINKRLEAIVSFDLTERLLKETEISESANARKATEGLWRLLGKYNKDSADFKNLHSFLETYGVQNILQVGKLYNADTLGKVERVSIWTKKTKEEKALIKFLRKQKKNINGNYNFVFNDKKYYKEKDKYVVLEKDGTTQDISEKDVSAIFSEYIEDRVAKVGTKVTLGKFLGGLKWNIAVNILGINPGSGIKNLAGGQAQLRQKAASGLWDFGMDQYDRAFNIFYGYTFKNLYKIIAGEKTSETTLDIMSKLPGIKHLPTVKRSQQIKVVTYLAEKLGLFSIKSEDNRGVDAWAADNTQSKIRDLVSGMAIDIPEFYNQMVGLVAMMQSDRYAVTDIHGNKHPLFDGKKGEFIFDVNTMRLKPEFRTEKNIENWENFKGFDGVAPHEILFARFNQMRNASQGNYQNTSKIGIEQSFLGSSAMTFLKWMPELINNEVGTTKLDPVWMKENTLGRALTVYAQRPYIFLGMSLLGAITTPFNVIATISYFVTSNKFNTDTYKNVVEGLYKSFSGLVSLAVVVRAAEISAWTKMLVANRSLADANSAYKATRINRKNFLKGKQTDNTTTTGEKFSEFGRLALELGLRSARTTSGLVLGGITRKKRALLTDERIKKLVGLYEDKYKNRDISYEERLLLSEKLQSYADSVGQAIIALIVLHSYKTIYAIFAALGGDDDDEDEKLSESYIERLEEISKDDKKRAKAMERVEKYLGDYDNKLNYLMTLNNGIQDEVTQFSNPLNIMNSFNGFMMIESMKKIQRSWEKAAESEGIFSEEGAKAAIQTVGVTQGIPNTIIKPLVGKETFGYEMVYGDTKTYKTAIYQNIRDYNKTNETLNKIDFNKKREMVREVLKNKIQTDLKVLQKKEKRSLSEEEIKALIAAHKDSFYKQHGLTTNKKTSFESKNSQIDWEKTQDKAKNYEVKSFIKPTTKNKLKGKKSKSGLLPM